MQTNASREAEAEKLLSHQHSTDSDQLHPGHQCLLKAIRSYQWSMQTNRHYLCLQCHAGVLTVAGQ